MHLLIRNLEVNIIETGAAQNDLNAHLIKLIDDITYQQYH